MDESVVKHLGRPLDSVARRLLSAAEHIDRVGLWKSGEAQGFPRSCALLAICRADPLSDPNPAIERFRIAMGFNRQYEIADWNDAPERTQEDVVSALRRVANGE